MAKETNLTPYELRLQLLQMAKDMLERNYDLQRDMIMNQWMAAIDWAKTNKLELPPMPTFTVAYPTLDDIMAQARKMNEFVSQSFLPSKKD